MYTKNNVIVTPQEAALWLETKNSRNRPVSESTVERYAQEMRDSKWANNGQNLIFGQSGQLLNGQHRLKACVRSNKPFITSITWGVEDSTFDTIDDGNSRSLSDVLHIKGEANSRLLAAGTRFLWEYATGQIETKDLRRGKIATKGLLEATLDKHPKMRSSVKFYAMLKSRPGGLLIPAAMASGLHYLFSLINESKADEFFTRLQSGLELSEGHPVALLRQRLIAGQTASTQLTRAAMYYYVVMAWNAFASDTFLRRLTFTPDTLPPEIENLPKKFIKDLL